jgi:tetratricopeptide (TPR) repeat protein
MRVRELQQLLGDAFSATNAGDFSGAKETYLEIISRAGPSVENPLPAGYEPVIAQARNNVAWLLTTCPKTEIRDARLALEHARAAVAIEPKTGNYWNTLGVALYRNGDWDLAKDALSRSMELRHDGDSFDWFFLAIIHFKQGRMEQARNVYDKAVQWYQKSAPYDEELYRFQVEAALELGLPQPTPRPSVPLAKVPRRMRVPGGPPMLNKKVRPTLVEE